MDNRSYYRANEIVAEAPTVNDLDKVLDQLNDTRPVYSWIKSRS